jgi:hypothetical protein
MPDKPRYSADQSLLASKAAQMRKAAAENTGDTTMDTGMAMDTAMPAMPAPPTPAPPADYGQLSPELNELPLDAMNVEVEPGDPPAPEMVEESPVLSSAGDPYEYQIGAYVVGDVPPVKARARGATEWFELAPDSEGARAVIRRAALGQRGEEVGYVPVEGESPVPLEPQFGESPVPLPPMGGKLSEPAAFRKARQLLQAFAQVKPKREAACQRHS